MKVLTDVPTGFGEVVARYGNPDADGDDVFDPMFAEAFLEVYNSPFPMRVSWRPKRVMTRIYGHRDVIPVVVDALEEILAFGGYEFLQDNGYDEWGGCWNWRPMKSGRAWSTHAWGIAVDLNPSLAPYGKPSRQPAFIVDAFVRRGFVCGDTFRVVDGMHFQACKGY